MKLTKIFGQYKKGVTKVLESELVITIVYDHKNDNIENVVSVSAYNSEKKITTDLTAIFEEQFPDQLDDILMGIDWREIYREHIAYKTEDIYE